MIISRHFLYFIFLGLFWGLSQSLYKAMALQNMPISHVIVYAGFGVGLGLMVAARLSGTQLDFSREVIIFGLGCAILLNVPFAIGLYLIRHLPATEMALIVSTAPFFNYVIALATGRENAVPRRLACRGRGFRIECNSDPLARRHAVRANFLVDPGSLQRTHNVYGL